MRRRAFLAGAAGASALGGAKTPVVLLRSGWQTINIGDVAHTPGVLAVVERHMPEARVILWPASIGGGADAMLRRRFPNLQVAEGAPESPAVRAAFREATVLIHGSAASMGSQAQVTAWRTATGKPYGFFGVGFTIQGEAAGAAMSPGLRENAEKAAFLFTRERSSLANLDKAGIRGPRMGFAPDGTFSMDIVDEARAAEFLSSNGLAEGGFLCLIPRLRYTPYHKIRRVEWTAEEIRRRESVNERHAETDHAKLREVAIAWVRKTRAKVLLCPEMEYQIELIDPLLYNDLPADVKPHVVRRKQWWLPDEAASVYRRAAAVVSCECHSPILAAVQGTPCIYVHQSEDGIKANMWPNLGLGDWLFEIEEATGAAIAARVLEIHASPRAARAKVREAVQLARRLQDDAMRFVREVAAR